MKAVVFHGVGDIRLEDVEDPRIEEPTDAVVRITASSICGTDLHMVRGTLTGMKPGTVLGHEGVGVVEELGDDVRNLKVGDRVLIASTIACGDCAYCREGYFAQCDRANPNGPQAGTAFFGGPETSGPFQGLQAERARIPFANVGLVKLPDSISNEQAILLSDILPTGWMAAELAEIKDGDTVAVFGCGPVGQAAIAAARHRSAGRIFAVDNVTTRLEMARALGAEVIDFSDEDPVEQIRRLTDGIGVDRAIDAVGIDAKHPRSGSALDDAMEHKEEYRKEVAEIAPEQNRQFWSWRPGDAPTLALDWAVQSLAKAGTLAVIGVYPSTDRFFPLGYAMGKNLTINMGICNHRKYIPELVELVRSGQLDLAPYLTEIRPLSQVIDSYKAFERRDPYWSKVEIQPGA
ncbi:zinc-dependent alcohol dehydrogenase [Vulgatibacter incomptus]|nr:zinc-dependent alcohol dehydrogenase [Vulgatibacter incomptus]